MQNILINNSYQEQQKFPKSFHHFVVSCSSIKSQIPVALTSSSSIEKCQHFYHRTRRLFFYLSRRDELEIFTRKIYYEILFLVATFTQKKISLYKFPRSFLNTYVYKLRSNFFSLISFLNRTKIASIFSHAERRTLFCDTIWIMDE